MTSDENTGRVGDTVGDDDLLDLLTESLLDSLAGIVELLGLFLTNNDPDELLALELLELSDSGSTRRRTSKPFFLRTSRKGESLTAERD